MTPESMEAFIQVARASMNPENAMIAIGMAATLSCLVAELKAKRISIARLSSLMFGASTERTAKVTGAGIPKPRAPREMAPGHGKTPALAIPGAEQVHCRTKP